MMLKSREIWQYRSPWSPRVSSINGRSGAAKFAATLLTQLAERDAERSEQAALIAKRDAEIKLKQLKIDQLTHEMATLRRWRYGRHSEQLDVVQRSLLDESIDADIEAISLEIEASKKSLPRHRSKTAPRRTAGIVPTPGNPP